MSHNAVLLSRTFVLVLKFSKNNREVKTIHQLCAIGQNQCILTEEYTSCYCIASSPSNTLPLAWLTRGSKTDHRKAQTVSENKNSVVVAITTFYPKPEGVRFNLALQTIRNAVTAGHAVVVVDSSPLEVREELQQAGGRVFPQLHTGLGPAKRESFFHALEICNQKNRVAVLACEAEKDLSQFIPQLVAPLIKDEANVVVMNRTDEGWNSYPEFQRESERKGNAVFLRVTGLELDIFAGPVLFGTEASRCFLNQIPGKIGFPDTYVQHLGIIAALAIGFSIKSVTVDFRYPIEQREEEEKSFNEIIHKKRIDQLTTLSTGYNNALQGWDLLRHI